MLKWLGSLTDSNEKQINRLRPIVLKINELESDFEKLTDDELKVKTEEFKACIFEAVSQVNESQEKIRREIADNRSKLDSSDEIEREEINTVIKNLEDRIDHLEDEKREIEKDVLDDLLPEAFAAVREAAKRAIKQRHFDSQLIGGIVLHQGKIAEMKTGEGKTLAATLPLYLNSLTGKGCHLVTVNDYLAKRDAHWMGPVYNALGVSVGAIHSQTASDQAPSFVFDPAYDSEDKAFKYLRPVSRREAYTADITYGTNNEFGFDYLRDNMVIDLGQCVQQPLNYAIVDEVDNLLIDEARTPLIISGPPPKDELNKDTLYRDIASIVKGMKKKVLPHEPVSPEEKDEEKRYEEEFDYIAYEKTHEIKETIKGHEKLARAFHMTVDELFQGSSTGMLDTDAERRATIVAIFRQSLQAHTWYIKDRNYIISTDTDGRPGIVIVDEFTGRLMHGRRYSEGLHQAIEAKERLEVRRETLTYATVTFQNYFRMYHKLAGMTGTAQTEAEEFHRIYELEVVQIPTNRPMIRHDFPDRIYKDEKSKFNAVVNEVVELNNKKRPILIGTVSIEKSELLSQLLRRKGVSTKILNAKPENAQKEAAIVAEAGRLGSVTVATNMAGRGVDIILGGNPDTGNRTIEDWQKEHDEVVNIGGLHIIGTERHEARRIDNQLRGRAGRQGDPGSTRFYVSLDDDIMKRFGGDRIRGIMNFAGMDENTPIENKLVNRAVESAQVRVEGFHFDIRKHLVEFDDVINKHRELIYGERRKILSGANLKANILSMVADNIHDVVVEHQGNQSDGWDVRGAIGEANLMMPLPPDLNVKNLDSTMPSEVEEKLVRHAEELYTQRENEFGSPNMRLLEKLVMLRIVDNLWVQHLTLMDEKRKEANWATLQQVKAIDAYKNMGGQQWEILMSNIRHDVANTIFHVAIVKENSRQAPKQPAPSPMAQVMSGRPVNKPAAAQSSGVRKVGRNDPCPCGSGKKYKHCHGR